MEIEMFNSIHLFSLILEYDKFLSCNTIKTSLSKKFESSSFQPDMSSLIKAISNVFRANNKEEKDNEASNKENGWKWMEPLIDTMFLDLYSVLKKEEIKSLIKPPSVAPWVQIRHFRPNNCK